jgi:hypothetical protein
MKKETEIIFENELISSFDDLLNLKIGDRTYFSVVAPTPRSIQIFKEENSNFPEHILDGVVNNAIRKSKEYHIKHFEVVDIVNSLIEDYTIDMSPIKKFTQSITVVEVTEGYEKLKNRDNKILEILNEEK